MKKMMLICMLLIGSHPLLSQSDTVFIKYDTDETRESISYTTDTVLFGSRLARQFLIDYIFTVFAQQPFGTEPRT